MPIISLDMGIETKKLANLKKRREKMVDSYLHRTGGYLRKAIKSNIGKGTRRPRAPGKPMSFRKQTFVYVSKKTRRPRSVNKIIFHFMDTFTDKAEAMEAIDRLYTLEPVGPRNQKAGFVRERVGFEVDLKEEAVYAGPADHPIQPLFSAHNYGGMYEGRRYPARNYVESAEKKARSKTSYKKIKENTLDKIVA